MSVTNKSPSLCVEDDGEKETEVPNELPKQENFDRRKTPPIDSALESSSGWALTNIQKNPRIRTRRRSRPAKFRKLPVRVHVYDLLDEECEAEMGIGTLNFGRAMTMLNDKTLNSMNFGFFHAGVEVNDLEYSFGFIEEGTGMFFCHPKKSPGYTYRCTIDMGFTDLTDTEVDDVITMMLRGWSGDSYRLIGRNCCNFAAEFCLALGVGPPPVWINALAESLVPMTKAGQALSESSQAAADWAVNYRPPPITSVVDENFRCVGSTDENHRCWLDSPHTYPTIEGKGEARTLQEIIPKPSRNCESYRREFRQSRALSRSSQDARKQKSGGMSWLMFFFCGDEDRPQTERQSLVAEFSD